MLVQDAKTREVHGHHFKKTKEHWQLSLLCFCSRVRVWPSTKMRRSKHLLDMHLQRMSNGKEQEILKSKQALPCLERFVR